MIQDKNSKLSPRTSTKLIETTLMGKVYLLYVGNFTHNQFKSNTFYEKFHENICIFKHND